jgi:hypothetical protein
MRNLLFRTFFLKKTKNALKVCTRSNKLFTSEVALKGTTPRRKSFPKRVYNSSAKFANSAEFAKTFTEIVTVCQKSADFLVKPRFTVSARVCRISAPAALPAI